MLAGLNFRDLAVPLATLKWAVPPERMDIPSREPYTRVRYIHAIGLIPACLRFERSLFGRMIISTSKASD